MKKKQQLGMNTSTATNRLTRDLLFKFIVLSGKNECYRCKQPMTRQEFSIEHVTPWLDSEDPVGLFFDLDNVSFSHQKCNTRWVDHKKKTQEEMLAANRNWKKENRIYDPVERRDRYLRLGT